MAKRLGTCIHFTELRDRYSCCKAGVNYSEAFGINKPGILMRMPCIKYHMYASDGRSTYIKAGDPGIRKEIDRRGFEIMPCAQFREPTPEEIEADRRETDASLRRVMVAIKVSNEWLVTPVPAQDRNDVVECPVCKGKLHLSQSSYNGHVHGKCETAGCVSWME